MSQEKAQALSERYRDINDIMATYDIAINSGIRSIMLNSNDRAKEICEKFKNNNKYTGINWYPSIPYPHKYANLVAEKGIMPAISEVLLKDNSAGGVLGLMAKGSMAVLSKDVIKMMQMLIDVEMKMFKGLNIKVVFLQNVITDLILGYGIKEIFVEYTNYIRNKYCAIPGLITQNMPYLKSRLEEWGVDEIVICSSFNKIGYLMSPGLKEYISAASRNDPTKYQLMAMSTLASGAVPPNEAFEFINSQNIQSVVFGASSRKHIEETVKLIKL